MKRLEYDRYGGPDLIHLADYTLPAPREDELIVRVAVASINPMDWKILRGDMKMVTGSKFPRALGTDFAGTVEAVGSNVSDLKPGDAVVGTTPMKNGGAFAPRLVTTRDLVVRKPDRLSFAEAATLPIAGVTAWQALVQSARLTRGQRVFVNGALGAVGHAAIAIARDIGADIVGRVSPRSMAEARLAGIGVALDYTKPLPTNLYGTFDVVFDTYGSLTPREGDRLAKRGGKIVDIVPTKQKFLRALVSRSRKFLIASPKTENLQPVIDLAAAGTLSIPIVRTVALADAAPLIASLEQGKRLNGKAVIAF